ncbi:S-Ena type endospore appendage [Bacillus manliponensis]|uniref:S-Ena type endospore appendage n=1 Tax=Bacillus manliponensis TaxID=574376 RepID=UPI003518E8D9
MYSNNLPNNITSSSFIKYKIGTNEITVYFFQSTTIIDSITLQPQSSGTFTVKGFTHIQIVTATGLHQGEFCMTLSYPLQ